MPTTRPFLSVVIPARNASHMLSRTLPAIVASELPRECWELIIVDDGSTDDTAVIAGAYADLVIRLTGHAKGPGYARNRGVERARGECVVFFDADVLVRPDTLTRFAVLFANEPAVAAAFGAYDDRPTEPGAVSQYRNLLHHFTHLSNAGEAYTFWAGCGAVRRHVFVEAGMYDEWRFPRPQIEDIELGHRIRALGHRILLIPGIQVTHLKRWTLSGMIKADFKDRGVPWARLLIERHVLLSMSEQQAQTLNLRMVEKINTVLVWLALTLGVVGAWLGSTVVIAGAFSLLLPLFWTNRPLYRLFRQHGGWGFALRVVPLHFLYYVVAGLSVLWGWLLANVVGEPRPHPTTEALSEIGLETWPPVPFDRKRPSTAIVLPNE